MIFLTLCSEIPRSPAISEISPAILGKIIMSFSNQRWFQFSNHRWFQFWHVSGCDLGAKFSTLKGTESYTYSIGRWSTKHKFGAAHLARESSANWIQTRYCFGYLNHRWFFKIFTVISRKNHRWFLLPPPVRKYNSKCQPPVIWYMKQKDHNESLRLKSY